MDLKIAALLSLNFLLLLTHESEGATFVPMSLSVKNELLKKSPQTYSTSVAVGGILVSAMRRLQESTQGFTFTVTKDPNFGLFLESVNGVAGNVQDNVLGTPVRELRRIHLSECGSWLLPTSRK